MKVSVILTTYNRPAFLERAIESVLNQTYQDFELLLMDDNSDDPRQIEILNKYKYHPKVRLYISDVKNEDRAKKTRYSVLINQAMKVADGSLYSYCCDDDFFYPEKLQKVVDYFKNNGFAGVVYGAQHCIDRHADGSETVRSTRTAERARLDASCNVDHSSVIVRKSVCDIIGDWNESPTCWGAADAEYWERLNKAGYTFYNIPDVLDAHVYHDGSWTKDGNWQKLGTK